MIMMDRYNKETSQIHAPSDLIRKTKEAVRAEEQRIAEEQSQQYIVVQSKRFYGRVYKWALPVAAAVFCLVLFNVGVMRLGRGMDKSQSNTSMDTASGAAESNDMGMQLGAFDMVEEMEEEAAEEPIGKGGTFDTTAEITEETAYDSDGYEGGQNTAATALRIEEFEEVPSFYVDSEMEQVIVHDITFNVWQDQDNHWIAYVCLHGKGYVISGELTEEMASREEFVEKAYELLAEEI